MNRFPLSGYLGKTDSHLQEIIAFIREQNPDVIGLTEVDGGSYRTGRRSQAETIAAELGHYHTYRSKYREAARVVGRIPVLNKQGNAFITRDSITRETFHYVSQGMKRLVIELELDDVVFFLVHLALGFKTRHLQLRELRQLIRATDKPCIVAGDFNALIGRHELDLFQEAAGLTSACPQDAPTYPSWNPNRHLNFVLASKGITVNHFEIPRVQYSDHLPLVCDFSLQGAPV